jgi:hypothetical protein
MHLISGEPKQIFSTTSLWVVDTPKEKGQRSYPLALDLAGRGDWIRTSDHLHPMQVRYQAALRPDDLKSLFILRFLFLRFHAISCNLILDGTCLVPDPDGTCNA